MKLLIVQHSWDDPPGLLGELILARGWTVDVYHPTSRYLSSAPLSVADLPRDDQGYGGLVILGGSMDAVDDAHYPHFQTIFALINAFDSAEKPILGLCLGAQLIARHYGAEVSRMDREEIGLVEVYLTTQGQSDPLLSGFAVHQRLMEWHRDRFELPREASLLVSGKECRNQIFRIGRKVYASQGHLEATSDIVRRWIFEGRDDLPPLQVHELPAAGAEIDHYWQESQQFARIVLTRWLDLIE